MLALPKKKLSQTKCANKVQIEQKNGTLIQHPLLAESQLPPLKNLPPLTFDIIFSYRVLHHHHHQFTKIQIRGLKSARMK